MTAKQRLPRILLPVGLALVIASLFLLGASRTFGRMQLRTLSALIARAEALSPGSETLLLAALADSMGAGESAGLLLSYGYTAADFAAPFLLSLSPLLLSLLLSGAALTACCLCTFGGRQRARMEELTRFLESANLGQAVPILPRREDGFSTLEDELLKTVTHLVTAREEALGAKASAADHLTAIAHQLKTPIAAAQLNLRMLGEKDGEIARRIERQLARLARLEEALLTLARIDAGALVPQPSHTDAASLLLLAADVLSELTEQSGIAVELPENDFVPLHVDPELTLEALINLMKDCAEHAASRVVCRCASNPLYAEITLEDDGPGFSPEDLPRAFDRFYRGVPCRAGRRGARAGHRQSDRRASGRLCLL
ncbi:MAG: HAMP domain-containing sensor histidine kinase [Clostridia bacterium]|nr:HAMP domain-containing sensor histidine kinase [Clostridia bacterium]